MSGSDPAGDGRPLDIAVVSQFFTPEMGAPAARFHDFGRMLVERGHRVTVVTGFPNSPSGVVPTAYRGRLRDEERIDGIRVLRSWLFTSPRLSSVTKSLSFGSFAVSASLRALGARLHADVVIATSPPPTVAIPGYLLARRLGAPLVFDVRDIWPEAIAASQRLRSGALIRTLEALERAVYRTSAAVTVVTEGKRERLVEKGVAAEKIFVIPNGVDLSRFESAPADDALAALGLASDRFKVLYAGVFNPPQGLDVLLDAAAWLREHDDATAGRIQIGLMGGGSEKDRLARRIEAEGLEPWVKLLPEQPRERIPALLHSADAIAVTLRPRRDTHTVPSKIYEAMASGRPILVSADGAPVEIVRSAEVGLASAAGDAEGLARAIGSLVEQPERARALGERGREYATTHDRRVLVDRFESVLRRAADRSRPRALPDQSGSSSS